MGQPIWQIRAQNLGTIAENIFFEYGLEAIDTDLQPVSYSLIAGTLPEGIQLTGTSIAGIPIKITGIPADVEVDTRSQFSIRATTTTNEVSDITLDLTVSGQTAPEITTVSGELGQFFYGDYVDLQLDAIDEDISNVLTWSVINDTLPDGLVLTADPDNDRIAYIRGYPVPVTELPPGIVPGFDVQDFDEDLDEFGFDFGLNSIDKNFEFVISVTDGIGFDSNTFSIFLKSELTFTADNDIITADTTEQTADTTLNSTTKIDPIMVTDSQDLGIHLHENYFTFQFEGLDFEGDQINFREATTFTADNDSLTADSGEQTADTTVVSSLPPDLILDASTGWLYGTIDTITTTEELFTFDVVTFKVANPTNISDPRTFTMTVISDLANSLIINSPLTMEISNGAVSELVIAAEANSDSDFSVLADTDTITVDSLFPTADSDTNAGTLSIVLEYSLVEGEGRLPVGLALTSTGLIVGRPFFTHNSWDMGDTIFDEGETLYNATFCFDVRIVDVTLGVIDQIQTFCIIVNPINLVAYENLYLVAQPTVEARERHRNLAGNEIIIPRDKLYRNLDPYFGVANDLRFLLADGLTASTRIQYSDILENNHYTRRFSFSKLKIAKAEGDSGNPSYELIYADVVDSLENNGESVDEELIVDGVDEADLTNRVPPATPQYNDLGSIIIKPASIVNMREIVINGTYAFTADNDDQPAFSADSDIETADATELNGVGQVNLNTLPDWMTTTQDDGRIYGFIPAIPLVFCLPGEAAQILFDINQSGFNLNEISFDVDRYHWDNNLTKLVTDYYLTLDDDQTSFDGVDPHGSFIGGVDWEIGDEIILENGAILTVNAINVFGTVTEFTITAIGLALESNIEIGASYTVDSDTILADNTGITADTHSLNLGTGFLFRPIRPSDEPDTNDELLKFPKTDVFQ